MAKSKTTSKKTTTRKKPAAKASSRASKAAAASKKVRARKAPAKKAPTKKKTTRKTSAKKAPAKKKKTTRKTSAKKAPVNKKKTTRKTSAKKAPAKKKMTTGAGKPTARAKTAKASRTTSATRRRGRSVAEAASATEADKQGYVFVNGRRVRMISTKGQTIARKSKVAGQPASDESAAPAPRKPVKTHLSRKELVYYRDLLLAKRRQLCGDLHAMEDQALKPGGGNLSHMPIHMADIGTDTFDQDFMLGLAESERQRLREIDEALARIENRTYGVCQMTGKPIPVARLEAKPWAKYTIEAARELERQWGA
ncbi:MAG: TraR/DksA C4-type zinc finger protein [Phycisphaerales bacterium]|nr:MAG: TraR/DksA C4-type zinc finger protein [Phycisphaerales bacterium]